MGFVVLDLPCGFGVFHLGRTSRGARPGKFREPGFGKVSSTPIGANSSYRGWECMLAFFGLNYHLKALHTHSGEPTCFTVC